MEDRLLRSDKAFLGVAALAVVTVLGITAYTFLYLGDHDFVVEAACDSALQTCFSRDCSEEDSCPPNGLEEYRVFTLSAGDFKHCQDNSCLIECTSGTIACEELMCDENEGDECSHPDLEAVPESLEAESEES